MSEMGSIRSLLVATLFFIAGSALAQGAPNQLSFQGRLVRTDGTPETGNQTLTFDLYDVATGGTPLWSQTIANVPVANGYYAVLLGGDLAPLGPEVFDGTTRYLGIKLAGQSEFTPRVALVSVPYALKAADTARLGGVSASSYSPSSHSHPAATSSSPGFLTGSDKSKLDNVPAAFGEGLDESGGTLRVAFSGSGSASSAARSDHAHTLSCSYRRNMGNDGSAVTATCNSSETLTGGGCSSLEAGTQTLTFGPDVTGTGNGSGGAGYTCSGGAGANNVVATAICCRVN